MVYNPSLGVSLDSSRGASNARESSVIYGRVVEVLLGENSPSKVLYDELGREDSLNGVFYKNLFDPIAESESEENNFLNLPFAYCQDPTLKRVPLKGEIVEITFKPKSTLGEGTYPLTAYYSYPLNIWNNAHHNALPDTKGNITEIDFGVNVVENSKIATLQPFSGDLILEGRLGQSLRFSGFNDPRNELTTEDNIGSPFAILKVGQDPEYDSLRSYVEDINKDSNSIYLTTKHFVPLEKSTTKQDTFRDTPPLDFNKYNNNQIILNSGRLILQANQDSIFLNSINSISFESTTINLDSTEYFSADAPEMFLGSNATEPAVLGDQADRILTRILELIEEIGTQFAKATSPPAAVAVLAGLSAYVPAQANNIKSSIKTIKSKKVKIE